MIQRQNAPQDSPIPSHPGSVRSAAISQRLPETSDGRPGEESAAKKHSAGLDEIFDQVAAGLYTLASMLIGEGEESVKLVEKAVETAEISSCDNAADARKNSRRALCSAALRILESRSPGCLTPPKGLEHPQTCIEDEELDAAGVSGEELSRMLGGPDRDRVRTWLGRLPTEQRVIFAMRAVAGLTSPETASLLASGARAREWSADAVREIFRQALCSLASQLLHATTAA